MGNVGLDRERFPSDAMGLAKLAGLGRLLTLCGSCASGCAVSGDGLLLLAASSRSEKLEATPATISRSSLTLWQGANASQTYPRHRSLEQRRRSAPSASRREIQSSTKRQDSLLASSEWFGILMCVCAFYIRGSPTNYKKRPVWQTSGKGEAGRASPLRCSNERRRGYVVEAYVTEAVTRHKRHQ